MGSRLILDGTVAGLLDSMDRSSVEQSVLCLIATRPEQFAPIPEWSKKIRSERIVPFHTLYSDALSLPELRFEIFVFSRCCDDFFTIRLHSPNRHPTDLGLLFPVVLR